MNFLDLENFIFSFTYITMKEIGVLRAIGLPRSWVYRIYIYEAFILVFSSSLLGIMIGTIVGKFSS